MMRRKCQMKPIVFERFIHLSLESRSVLHRAPKDILAEKQEWHRAMATCKQREQSLRLMIHTLFTHYDSRIGIF